MQNKENRFHNQQFTYQSPCKPGSLDDTSFMSCDDVDENIVYSPSASKQAPSAQQSISKIDFKPFREITNSNFNRNQSSICKSSSKLKLYLTSFVVQNSNYKSEFVSAKNFDPENVPDFKKAYQKLANKLGQEYGAQLMIPQNDKIILDQTVSKLPSSDFHEKINKFEEKKKHKIRLLKQEKETNEVKECKFEPEMATRKKGQTPTRRNLDKFLEDQKKFQEQKQQKIEDQKQQQQLKSVSQTLTSPLMNEKSRKILQERSMRPNSSQRTENTASGSTLMSPAMSPRRKNASSIMYSAISHTSSSNFKNVSKELNSSSSKLFSPQITKKAQEQKRDKPVQEILYDEAFKRKQKLEQKSKEIYKQQEPQINKESLKYVVQKFNKEFEQAINEYFALELQTQQNDENQNRGMPLTINYFHMKQLLVKMGFSSEEAANQETTERVLLYDIWTILRGDEREEIELDNLKVMIMAILKIYDDKRVIDHESKENDDHGDQIGYYKDQKFYLKPQDIQAINKQFETLYINRIQFQATQFQQRKQSVKVEHSFKPVISEVSSQIAQNFRKKLAECAKEEKIEPLEWLASPGNKQEWRSYAKHIEEQEELKKCTFTPFVSKASRELSSQRQPNSAIKDKNIQLFKLAQVIQRKPKEDKPKELIEFEKQKEECTFSPKISKIKVFNSSSIMMTVCEDSFVRKEIDRLQKGREEKERIKKFTERGIFLSNNNHKSFVPVRQQPQTTKNASTQNIKTFVSPKKDSTLQKYTYSSKALAQKSGNQSSNNIRNNSNNSKNITQKFNPIKPNLTHVPVNNDSSQIIVRSKAQQDQPLLFIDINMGDDSNERITVFEGDTAQSLAEKFCKQYQLDNETQARLEEQIQIQISSVLSKIEEESEKSELKSTMNNY